HKKRRTPAGSPIIHRRSVRLRTFGLVPTEPLSIVKTTGRRQWLSMVARGTAAATVGVLGRPRAARSAENGGDPRIKHIVVLMMENRSFDHMLGLLMNEIPDLRGVHPGEWTNADDKGNVHALTADAAYQ